MSMPDKNDKDTSRERQLNESGKVTASAKELPTPPDGGYGWVVVFAAFMINVIVDGIAYSYGLFIIELQIHYNSPSGITSMVGSLLNGMYLLSSPLAGFLINRYDSRIVTICGSIISTIGFAVSQFASSIEVMLITFGLIGGFGFGLMYLPAVVSVSFYFEKRRAMTTGIVVCGTGVGCFIFAILFQALITNMGWKYAMVMVAGITLQGAIFGALLRPLKARTPKPKQPSIEPRKKTTVDRANEMLKGRKQSESEAPHDINSDPHLKSILEAKEEALRKEEEQEKLVNGESEDINRNYDIEKQKEQEVHDNIEEKPSSYFKRSAASISVVIHGSTVSVNTGVVSNTKEKRSFLQTTGLYLLADPLFLIPILANLIAMLGHYIPFFFIVQRSIAMLEISHAKAAFLLSIIAITNTLGRVLMGFLADFKRVNSLLLHNIAIATSGIACILSMFCLNYVSTCIFAAYFGLCMATWISLSPIILCELLGLEKLTNAFGLLCFVRGISSFAGPPIAGMVYDKTKDYNNAFYVGGILLLIGGCIAFLLHLPYFQRRTYANKLLLQRKEALAKNLDKN